MADLQTLLDNAINPTNNMSPGLDWGKPAPSTVSTKQTQVAQAATAKQTDLGGQPPVNYGSVAAGMGNQHGAATMSPIEQDLRTLNPLQLSAKYVSAEANRMLAELGRAQRQRTWDASQDQQGGESLGDAATGVGSGFVGSLGGIAAWGLGTVNDDAGAWAAEKVQQGQDWLGGFQSDALDAHRRVAQETSALDYRDNAGKREQEIADGSSETMADLRRVGRDIVATVKNSNDPTLLVQGTSEGVGSLLAGGPVAKGIKMLGAAAGVGRGATVAGDLSAEGKAVAGAANAATATRTATAGEKALEWGAWPATIALLEGGGAYTGTLNEVMGMSHEQLQENSELYRSTVTSLVNLGMDPEEARQEAKVAVANRAAKQAAMIQAPISAVTGLLTRFEQKPFSVPSIPDALANTLVREPLEEAIQGTTGQVAQNVAIQNTVDESRVLSEGVGEQTAAGAIYGLTAAGTVQAPGPAGRAVIQGTRQAANIAVAGGKKAFNALLDLGDKRIQANEKASPVADTAIQQATAAAVATAPQDIEQMSQAVEAIEAEPAAKEEAKGYVSSLVQAMQFDGANNPDLDGLPDNLRQPLAAATNRADAVQAVAREVANAKTDQDKLIAASVLYELMQPVNALKEADPAAFDNMQENDPARETMLRYQKLVANMDNTPAVQRALRQIEEMVKRAAVQQMQPVVEQELNTTEGQQKVKTAIAVASFHPDQGNPEVVEGILKHAREGRLNLSPDQQNSLQASLGLLRARQTLEKTIADNGLQSAKDVVSSQVVASNDPLRVHAKSALQHTQGIVAAMRSKNMELAKARLEDFGMFVQHMKNKVDALNQHAAQNDPYAPGMAYQALMPVTREWRSSANNTKALHKTLFVNTRSTKSIEQAQSMAIEQVTLASVYNGLVNAFPELGQQQIEPTALDSRLNGKPEDVVKTFASGPKQTPAPAPVQAPKQEEESPKMQTPDDIAKTQYEQELRDIAPDLNLNEQQIQGLKERRKAARDAVTGWIDGRIEGVKEAAIKAAQQFVKDGGVAAYISFDIANLGGLNKFHNNSQDSANADFRGISDIVMKHLLKLDPSATLMRTGGDELSAILENVQPGQAQAAIEDARKEVAAYADKQGFGNIDHAKHGWKNFGVGIYGGITAVDPFATPNQISDLADAEMDIQKKAAEEGTSNVTGNTTETTGAVAPDRSATSGNSESLPSQEGRNSTTDSPAKSQGQQQEGIDQADKYISRITPEQASRLSDDGLNDRINALQDKMFAKTATASDIATFSVLDDEMSNREDAAQKQKAQSVKQPEPQKAAESAPAPEQKNARTGLLAVYPNLVNHVTNMFAEVFSLPGDEQAPTRIIGEESPVQAVVDALSSAFALDEKLGKPSKHTLTREIQEAYQQLLSVDPKTKQLLAKDNLTEAEIARVQTVGGLMQVMRNNLAAYMAKPYSNKDPRTMAEMFRNKTLLHRTGDGKVLNLTTPVGESYEYEPELLEAAALAGMQWFITAANYEAVMEDEDVASLTGVQAGELPADIVARLKQGVSKEQIKFALAKKIRNYWGVKAGKDADMAYADGIPEAMAAEIMRAMIELGMMQEDKIELGLEHGLEKPKTIARYELSSMKESPIQAFPTAIEEVVMVKPEEATYLDGDVPKVARTQMNNPDVENTKEQQAALKAEQQTPHRISMPMLSLYTAIGEQGVLEMFGAGNTEGKVFNKNHLKAVEGQNRTIYNAFRQLMSKAREVENLADGKGVSTGEVEIRYAYNMSRTGRMQMLGRHNPQSSKLVREVILPTWSTLNLSGNNRAHSNAFGLATAQALGVKVHKMPMEKAIEEARSLLSGSLAPALKLMQEWAGSTDFNQSPNKKLPRDFPVQEFKAVFEEAGVALTPAALHVLLETARLQATKDKSQFTTPLYLEADGVTNGPINAMMLMSVGQFTPEFVDTVQKGGIAFGERQPMHSLNQTDLYQTSTTHTFSALSSLMQRMTNQKKNGKALGKSMEHLLNLMSITLPDVNVDEKGVLTLKRGIAKNPLTITIYGSGERGIAGKLTSMVMDQLYEGMSMALQRQAKDSSLSLGQAYFYGEVNADAKFASLIQSLEVMTETEIRSGKDEFYIKPGSATGTVSFDAATFTLDKERVASLRQNMLEGFVKPMSKGIAATIGSPLMKAVKQVRTATQAQSIVLQGMYKLSLYQLVAEKRKYDPNFRPGDFISKEDRQQLMEGLKKKIAPLIETGSQSFLITKSETLSSDDIAYSRGLDGSFRTGPDMLTPANAGVAGIPFLTIGMGDGKMMQNLALDKTVQRTLKIFDGMHMPLDKIAEYSEKANQAVYDSYKGNPLREVGKAYSRFMEEYASIRSLLLLSPETVKDLRYALRDYGIDGESTVDDIMSVLGKIQDNVNWAADSIDARHKAMQQVAMSVDQMAAAASPYGNGKAELADTKPAAEEVVRVLNAEYQREMALREKTQEMDKVIGDVGREHKSGVRLVSWTSLKQLAKNLKLNDAQKLIYDQIIRSLGTKEYKIVAGTIEQISAYQQEHGLSGISEQDGQDTKGYVSIGDKTIYLINPSAETLVHELVHAASYEITLAHYQGESMPEVAEAISRLEGMMQQFMSAELDEKLNPEQTQALNDARAAIETARDSLGSDPAVAKAQALNEFMAWALTNAQLTEKLKQTRVGKLVQLAKDAIQAIKQLIWGKKLAPKVGEDFLSNLQFNASVLIRTQASLSFLVQQGKLFHATQRPGSRLQRMRDLLTRQVTQYIQTLTPAEMSKQAVDIGDAVAQAVDAAQVMKATFQMNAEEEKTFTMMVATLATEAKLNTNVLARAQELYAHVAKTLKVEDFIPENTVDVEAERYYALEKYNLIMGKTGRQVDKFGRTTMMPAFMALATVNEEFRKVLSKMEVPKSAKNDAGTVDAALENLGNQAMDSLHSYLSGEKHAPNIQAAMDALADKLFDTVFDEQNYLEQVEGKAMNALDSLNDRVVSSMNTLSDKGVTLGKKLTEEGNRVQKAAGRVLWGMSALISQENSEKVAEGIVAMMNKSDVGQSIRDLAMDLVGRTSSNSSVYDMIKQVRSKVQQLRQQFREHVPHIIASKFTRRLSEAEWGTMFRAMGKTDLAVLTEDMPVQDVVELLSNQRRRENEINDLEEMIKGTDAKHWGIYQRKMQQLAHFMNTGEPGNNLLRNAFAIGNLFGEGVSQGYKPVAPKVQGMIDKLVTLYAVDMLADADKQAMAKLVETEGAGLQFTLNYLVGQRKSELSKVTDGAVRANHYKGYIPSNPQLGTSLVVATDDQHTHLMKLGYQRVGSYIGSSLDSSKESRSYYFAPLSGKTAFAQGIMQNVKHTASGVDETYGFTQGLTAGRITEASRVKAIAKRMSQDPAQKENLMPVYDNNGQVVAFERSVSPFMLNKLNSSQHLGQMIGVWRGRQVEEKLSQEINQRLVDRLHDMYQKDLQQGPGKKTEYVNLLGAGLDTVQADAANLFSERTLEYAASKFGEEEFWVRKDMLNDVMGYRNASVGDLFTGNSRWSPETQKTVSTALIGFLGIDAYRKLVKSEQLVQGFFADARNLIVVKSVVVPAANFLSNMYQLVSNGVPLGSIAKGVPAKISEIQAYTKSKLRQIELEAELRAVGEDSMKERRLRAEIRSITDSHRRMSIWPLIEAGEFSSIEDVGMTSEDLELTAGNLSGWVERQFQKLPDSLKTAARYGYISRDTALFQGLQKAVQYGDFVAKAVLYDNLTQRKGMPQADALAYVTEEFVNYDVLPGRSRSYLENMGMLWFFNYKLRITKVALRTIRNNPLHALMAATLPAPDGVGLPVMDNVVTKAVEGTLGYSVGPAMAFHGVGLNPWVNLVN